MSESPERIEVVRQWVAKAENDLRNAEHTLKMQEDCPLDTSVFSCTTVYREIDESLVSLPRH